MNVEKISLDAYGEWMIWMTMAVVDWLVVWFFYDFLILNLQCLLGLAVVLRNVTWRKIMFSGGTLAPTSFFDRNVSSTRMTTVLMCFFC